MFNTEQEKKEWLKKYDHNNSGSFDRQEFMQLLADVVGESGVQEAAPTSIIDKIFADKQVLNPDEVHAALKRVMNYVRARSKLLDLFEKCDTDKNGYLDAAELRPLLQMGCSVEGYVVTQDDCDFVLRQCDADTDGFLSTEELGPAIAAWMEVCKTISDTSSSTPPPPPPKKSKACALL